MYVFMKYNKQKQKTVQTDPQKPTDIEIIRYRMACPYYMIHIYTLERHWHMPPGNTYKISIAAVFLIAPNWNQPKITINSRPDE